MNEQAGVIIVTFQAEKHFFFKPCAAGPGGVPVKSPGRSLAHRLVGEATTIFAGHFSQLFKQQICRLKILPKHLVFLIQNKNKLCEHIVSKDLC